MNAALPETRLRRCPCARARATCLRRLLEHRSADLSPARGVVCQQDLLCNGLHLVMRNSRLTQDVVENPKHAW